MTAGPLHGPLTFAEWLRTLTAEVELTGLLAEVTIEARAAGPGFAVELLPAPMLAAPARAA